MNRIGGLAALLVISIAALTVARADVYVYLPPRVRQMQGAVVDSSGRPIPGVAITVTHDGANVGTSSTNKAGAFAFTSLAQGEYELDFSAAGFQRAEYKVFLTRPSKHWNRFLRVVLAVGSLHCAGSISVVRKTK